MSNGDAARAPWEDWAPPLNPPDPSGIPYDVAEAIAEIYWPDEAHLCAALQWEYYAGMQDPAPSVSSVSTGIQSIAYSPPAPGGEYGKAIARAQWHRSFISGQIESVPLVSSVEAHELLPPLSVGRWRQVIYRED